MSDQGTVSLQLLRTVTSSLERVVAHFYGPQCCQTLMTSSTGKAVITSDGYTILHSILASHPLSIVITKAIDRCHSYTYDGCKTFIIYLSRFLALSEKEIQSGKFVPHGTNLKGNMNLNEQRGKLCISRCLRVALSEIMPVVYHNILEYCRSIADKNDTLHLLKCVGRNTLMPHFNPKLCDFLTSLLENLLDVNADINSLKNSLHFLLDNFSCLCIRSANQPYDRSQTMSTYIIQRDFILVCDRISEPRPVNILLINTPIDKSADKSEPREIMRIASESQLSDSLICRIKKVRQFAESCANLCVDVIISSEGIPQFALDILRARNISVVHYVLKQDIAILEKLTSTLAVTETRDICRANVIAAKGVKSINVNGCCSVQLQLDSKFGVKHLVLCAPTVGLCDQLYLIMQKAVKAMTLCLKTEDLLQYFSSDSKHLDTVHLSGFQMTQNMLPTSERETNGQHKRSLFLTVGDECDDSIKGPLIVPGGGGFEQLVSKYLKECAVNEVDSDKANICKLIGESVMYILNVLQRNTSEQSNNKHAHIQVQHQLQDQLNRGSLWGLNRRGEPADVCKNAGVMEPVLMKIHTLNCVLVLLEQLFRIEKTVGGMRTKSATVEIAHQT